MPRDVRPMTRENYDPEDQSCFGCQMRNGNIMSLLNGVLKAGKHLNIIREDMTLEELDGVKALHILRDMENL